ncbi:hypothetical protein BUALT_Bualt01G0011800 [Buddleja alternifolia]|uniref:Response regulatory domain-containing protein n=1 Tax=Buddleja alternifolia TaxID=168488 RepID=A0AAV6Y9K5_9LAMI|nr:hypothetical protein BUALT_Bualt01G0011800 [Buddleja alternifolia]
MDSDIVAATHDDERSLQEEEEKQHFHVLAVDDITCVDSGDKALEYLGLLDIKENEYERSLSSTTTTSCISNSPNPSHQEDSNSWKDVPVVVMSSENVPSRINMCLEGGAEEFLLKPVKLSDLKKLHSHLLSSITHPCDHHTTTVDDKSICNIEKISTEDNVETDKNCSNSNKRKLTTSTISSDLSDRRPRVQELHVS